ncbi:MAG: class I SAM-dependent methyltransferase [Planctomycetota bacterium]
MPDSPATLAPEAPRPPAALLTDLGLGADDGLVLRASEGASRVVDQAARGLDADGACLVHFAGAPSDALLARWREDCWPLLHAVALYRHDGRGLSRTTQSGKQRLGTDPAAEAAVWFVFRRALHVLSPDATREKFDANASGWNGEPGGPGYPHFRWMRRFVARFAPTGKARRIVDFGCGAGWVGIDAAGARKDVHVAAFDPSPQMVRIASDNARAQGLSDFVGRVGFGEAPPFPAEGEERFDHVISSGVVSFSPDFEAWMRGLTSTCAAGGTLVVGDVNPSSRGIRARRAKRPLMVIRELNGRRSDEVRQWLEARGFRHRKTSGYQFTWPMPQLMYVNETKLKGLLSYPLVWTNAALTWLDGLFGNRFLDQFDSWVMWFDVPADWSGPDPS